MMELRVENLTFPEVINFNFEELKKSIEEKTSSYVGLVYTEDQIKDAKKDVADLRKFIKGLSDERIKVKKDIMKPYEAFEKKIKQLSSIVESAIGEIDVQIKAFEEQKKKDKLDDIKNYWNSCTLPFSLTLEQIFEDKWLNASVSMKSVYEAIDNRLSQINNDLAMLSNLAEFSFEATEIYKTSLDLHQAVAEGKRLAEIAQRKAEQEQKKAEAEAMKHIEEFENDMRLQNEALLKGCEMASMPPVESDDDFIPSFGTVEKSNYVVTLKLYPAEKERLEQFLVDNNIDFSFA